MLTFPYGEKLLEWDKKAQTNKQAKSYQIKAILFISMIILQVMWPIWKTYLIELEYTQILQEFGARSNAPSATEICLKYLTF